jgi:hypothetical protein
MKIDRFIVSCMLFSSFCWLRKIMFSRLGRVINFAAGNFATASQSLQHYKTRSDSKCKLGWGHIGSRSTNPNTKIGLENYNEGKIIFKMFLYYLTNKPLNYEKVPT